MTSGITNCSPSLYSRQSWRRPDAPRTERRSVRHEASPVPASWRPAGAAPVPALA
jgi:hypothetical protein